MNETAVTKRIFGLDILRAAAILFVLQIHSLRFISAHTDAHYYWLFILDGVNMFFVLSGFLIGGILLRTINNTEFTSAALLNFWVRRWFRTLPNYFLILVVLLFGYYHARHYFPDKTLQFFFFTQCFAGPHPHFFPEAWSLAVEEWFYIIIPIGLFLLLKTGRNKRKIIIAWIGFVLIAVTVFRLYKIYTHHYIEEGTWDQNIRKQVLTRMDSIMYGFLGAYLTYYRFPLWQKWKNGLFISGLLVLLGSRFLGSEYPIYYKYVYISAQSIGTFLLLPKLNSIVTGKGILHKAITFISITSYSMYLLNYSIVLNIILPKISQLAGMDYTKNVADSVIIYILFWIITIILSWFLYRLYEKPMMNLREKFKQFKRKPG